MPAVGDTGRVGMTGRSIFTSAWFLFGLWILVIFGLSSWSDLGTQDTRIPGSDKLLHAGEYAILGILFARARLRGASLGRRAAVGAILGAAIGVLDEWYQTHTPGRDSSLYDALADTIGASIGAVVFRLRHATRPDTGITGRGKR